MRFAVLSDVHANFDALEAVLADVAGRGIADIVCLGDVVGYGPEPARCIDLVRERSRVCLMGNHDLALITQPYGFNPAAAQAIVCQRRALTDACDDPARCDSAVEWLKARPERHAERGVLFVHASPRDPINEYVLPTDAEPGHPSRKLREIFDMIDGPCFVGHSHYPGLITDDMRWLSPSEAEGYEPAGRKCVVNDGSVGQPRDRDPRASWVEVADGRICWRRVEYPFRRTMEKILASDCLPRFSAERLAEGR
jgi:diadenosine tetraphosphatase ApaH/serine/threonine PP2A family protein phosphatase